MIFDPEDRRIFRGLMRHLGREMKAGSGRAELVLAAGRYFLGAPYAAGTLESTPETVVINLRQFDCFTLVENAVVLADIAWRGQSGFPAYAASLQAIRYRKGIIDGYPSRLHYFTDWVYENMRRGAVKDLTRDFGGKSFRKRICHMTARREQYPALREERSYRLMKTAEKRISRRLRHEIPRSELPAVENKIAAGDLIAVLTNEDGLDCLHVGLAVYREGRVYFLHASRESGAVVVSKETLSEYLNARAGRSGILIARMMPS
jgi:hypothetical protein